MTVPDRALAAALCAAREDADALHRLVGAPPLELALVCCSYDSAFEPVAAQVAGKVQELLEVFPRGGPVALSLVVVNDRPRPLSAAFQADVRAGFGRCPAWLLEEERLLVLPLSRAGAGPWGSKGLALREGMLAALRRGADVVAYVNLNRKAHAAQAATGLRLLLERGLDAAVGSRAFADGGAQVGAGLLGRAKSRAFASLVQAALPPLAEFPDVTGPMKLFTPAAARVLVERGRNEGCCFDAEWLALLLSQGLTVGRFPLLWRQRPGSVPPWDLVGEIAADLVSLRRAFRRGTLGASPRLHAGLRGSAARE